MSGDFYADATAGALERTGNFRVEKQNLPDAEALERRLHSFPADIVLLGISVLAGYRVEDRLSAVRAIRGSHPSSRIVMFLDERISDDALQPFLKDFTKTIVIVNRATKLPVIAMPPPNSALMTKIMEYGVQLGYEVFIFATSNTFFNNFLERKNAFDAFVKEHKLEEDILEGALIHTPDLVKERLMQCMKRHKGRRILFVCPGDYVGRAVADYLQQMGYEFKKEVGVVSIEGLDFAMERKPLLTTVAFSPQMLGEMAVSKMLPSIARIDRRSEPDNESIPFTMQFGDTM